MCQKVPARFLFWFCHHVMGSTERTREIRRRRARRAKLKKLREKFAKATSDADKAALLAKAQRVSPLVTTLELVTEA